MGEFDMNDKEKHDLALSKRWLLGIAAIGLVVVIWLAWFR